MLSASTVVGPEGAHSVDVTRIGPSHRRNLVVDAFAGVGSPGSCSVVGTAGSECLGGDLRSCFMTGRELGHKLRCGTFLSC